MADLETRSGLPVEGVAVKNLFPRGGCVSCPDTTPECPACPSNQSCQVTALTCTACPKSYCADNAPATPTASPKHSSSATTGATAGGVIGGVAVIALVTYLVWRYCIKAKRQQLSKADEGGRLDSESMDGNQRFSSRRDQRASTHTAHSIASTVLTRASNIIQIAYIPGVMNRANPTSPTVLVPPVPPIPIAVSGHSQASTPSGPDDQHFFVPGDLRDSTYSGYSGFSDRTSFARTSYAPRSSIASTIYGKSAVIAAPPQTGMRIKPTMVNLKSPSNLGPGSQAMPPVPTVDYGKYSGNLRPVSEANSAFSVGSTFLSNASAHTATQARPVVVRVGTGPKKADGDGGSTDAEDEILPGGGANAESDALMPSDRNKQSTSPLRESTAYTIIEDSPTPSQGPFADPPLSPSSRNASSTLSAVIEEATRRASQKDLISPASPSSERGRSPFGDEHATHDHA